MIAGGAGAVIAAADGSAPSFTFTTDESGAKWDCALDNAPTTSCVSPQAFTGLAPGQHTFTATSTFTVPLPSPPTAAFSFSPTNPTAGQSVHFDGSASTCPGGGCTYGYQDASGTTLITGQSGDYTFASAGTQQVTLAVTDQYGQTNTVEHDVVVSNPVTGDCTQTSGIFADNFDTHFNAPGGVNPNLCPGFMSSPNSDVPGIMKPASWDDNVGSNSGVPQDCFNQGTPPAPGQGTGALKIYANGGFPGSTQQDCLWLNHWRHITYPSDTYYGVMWYFPNPGYTDPSGGGNQRDIITEFNWHPYISSGPEGFSLFGDTLQWRVRTGLWCHLCVAQYDNGAERENPPANTLSGNMAPVQDWRVIPVGSMTRNRWIETIVHVHWANDTTGKVEAWWRYKGDTTWNKSIDQTGFPTIDWGPSINGNGQHPYTWTADNEQGVETLDHWGIYRSANQNTQKTTFWIDNFSEQPTFNGAAGSMP